MDGYEATQQIKATRELQTIPIIALTASAMRQEEDKIQACGFDGYLRKPVDRTQVLQELTRFLAHSMQKTLPKQQFPIEPLPTLPAEIQGCLSELIDRLEQESMLLWETICQSGSFDEIKAFGHHIQQLGEIYTLEMLRAFGKQLLTHTRNFDVEQMGVMLDAYPQLIEHIKALSKPQEIKRISDDGRER
jgi:two-component system sensor histidine kinase EvgS